MSCRFTLLRRKPRLRALPSSRQGGASRRQAFNAFRRAGPEPNMVQGRHGREPVGAPQTNLESFLTGAEPSNALFPLSISGFRVSILAIRRKVAYNVFHCIEPIPSLPTHFRVI
jgi:hypothetical protein